MTETFKYHGLNRQVSSTVAGTTTYNVYDGWDLIEEYQAGSTVIASYLYVAGGLVKNLTTNNYYYQDGSGSTSHLADSSGHLLEWYRYDLQGTPTFYNFLNTQQSASAYGVRHLFTGQQWYSELGLYDLRNRFYSPDIGRFLEPDPSGFNGDPTNLYRYCGNDPLDFTDPTGLDSGPFQDVDSALRYLHATLNPLSVKENLEFRTLVYRNASGEIWTNKTAVGTSHNAAANDIPHNAMFVGDYHTHGDYSYRNPVTGQVTRASGPPPNIRGVADNQGSNQPSPKDKRLWQDEARGSRDFSGAVSTPGGKLIKWDQQHSQPYSISTAPVPVPKHQDPPPNIPIRIN